MKLCSLEERNGEGSTAVRLRVNSTLPLASSAGSQRERGQGSVAAEAQPVTGRRGGSAAAAGRTVLAARVASFDGLMLCSAAQGAQPQGLVPGSLPYPITCRPLLAGQVEVAA